MPEFYISYVNSSSELNFDYEYYLVNASGGEITVTLPEISADGQHLNICKMNDAEHDVIIEPFSGNSINVGATIVLSSYEAALLITYNNVWYRFNK